MDEELAKCPKCGEKARPVDKHGFGKNSGKFVSCHAFCMPVSEFYSPAAWNAMAEREEAYKARIAELEGNAGAEPKPLEPVTIFVPIGSNSIDFEPTPAEAQTICDQLYRAGYRPNKGGKE